MKLVRVAVVVVAVGAASLIGCGGTKSCEAAAANGGRYRVRW